MDDYLKRMERILQDQDVAMADAERRERLETALSEAQRFRIGVSRVRREAKSVWKSIWETAADSAKSRRLLTEDDVFIKLLEIEIAEHARAKPSN